MKLEHNEYLRIMMDIGMPLSSVGTAYAIECLEMIQETEYKKYADLYKAIAKKHSTNAANVEKCIGRAFSTCRDKPTDYDIVEKYIGYARTGTAETLIHLFVQIKLQNETK